MKKIFYIGFPVAIIFILAWAVSVHADETIPFSDGSTQSGQTLFGRSGDVQQLAVPFTTSADAEAFIVMAGLGYRASGYLDPVQVLIQGDNAGEPDGATIATVELPADAFEVGTCSLPTWEVTFPTGTVHLDAATTYWVVFHRNGTYRAPNDNPALCAMTDGTVNGDWSYPGDNDWGNDMSGGLGINGWYGEIQLLTDAPSGGGGGDVGGATSTPDQTQQNLFFGFVVFFMSAAFVVWTFKRV